MSLTAKRIVFQAAVVLATLLFAAIPALAARKVLDIKIVNISTPVGDVFTLPEVICGVQGPFGGEFVDNLFQFTMWDNGHFNIRASNTIRVVDSEGNLILHDRFALHDVSGTTSLPNSFGINLVSHCTPNSATPGKAYEFHITRTVGEDGTLKQIHGEFCDPSAYPFC